MNQEQMICPNSEACTNRYCLHQKPHQKILTCSDTCDLFPPDKVSLCQPVKSDLCPTCHQPLDRAALINQIMTKINKTRLAFKLLQSLPTKELLELAKDNDN